MSSGERRTGGIGIGLVLGLTAFLAGCGGGSSPSGPSVVPTPTPTPAPQRILISQGGQSDLPPYSTSGKVLFGVLTTTSTGVLEANVNWTFATNAVSIAWAQGDCLANQQTCQVLVFDASAQKPKTLATQSLPPGTYTLIVENDGTTTESVSYQVFQIR